MKTLILEDDYAGRLVLQRMLLEFGEVDLAVNGKEALQLFTAAHTQGVPYELIFLDLMVPEISGQTVLREMRSFEQQKGITKDHAARIIMMTALSDKENVVTAIKNGCDSYLVKPVRVEHVREQLHKFGKDA